MDDEFDPETTYQKAEKKAAEVRNMYENWEKKSWVSEVVRIADPLMRVLPKKPPLEVANESPQMAQELNRRYEILRDERSARFKVISAILPKTVELAEKAEQAADADVRQQLEKESLEA